MVNWAPAFAMVGAKRVGGSKDGLQFSLVFRYDWPTPGSCWDWLRWKSLATA
jgi:hypothetical protein